MENETVDIAAWLGSNALIAIYMVIFYCSVAMLVYAWKKRVYPFIGLMIGVIVLLLYVAWVAYQFRDFGPG